MDDEIHTDVEKPSREGFCTNRVQDIVDEVREPQPFTALRENSLETVRRSSWGTQA